VNHSYCQGWLDAIRAMTDLVLAEKMDFVDAQVRCMDWYHENLLPRTAVPVMPRESLRTVSEIPFTDEPEDQERGHNG